MRKYTFSSQQRLVPITVLSLVLLLANTGQADEVHAINTIVEGHLCASDFNVACVNPEPYTSSNMGTWADFKAKSTFPQFLLESTATGGNSWGMNSNFFGVDAFAILSSPTASTTAADWRFAFRIESGAGDNDNLLYLDAAERIGINTTVPAFTMDLVGNRIRLTNGAKSIHVRADGTDTDIEAIGADLFLRSSTIGQNIVMNPFGNDGNVGIGTVLPTAKLHVATFDGNGQVLIQEQNGTVTRREVFRVENNGDPSFVFQDTSSGNATEFRLFAGADDFVINHLGTGGPDLKLDRGGNLEITGSLSQGSSITTKTAIVTVLSDDVLHKVLALPVSSWQYKKDEPEVRHLGPMAEDFHAVFGLGEDDRSIAPADMAGVALAAIQAQQLQIEQQRQDLSEKNGQIADLQTRLAAIEKRLSE